MGIKMMLLGIAVILAGIALSISNIFAFLFQSERLFIIIFVVVI